MVFVTNIKRLWARFRRGKMSALTKLVLKESVRKDYIRKILGVQKGENSDVVG